MRTAPTPANGTWIASDSSQYSPVARFRTYSSIDPAGIHIVIDSGTVAVPGEILPSSPPLMSDLYLTAILAVPDSGSLGAVQPPAGAAPAERRAWRPVATSDSVHVVNELHYGERVSMPRVRLTIPMSTPPRGVAWIVYRISGNAIEINPPSTPGGQSEQRAIPGGVRVYACGDMDVSGSLDSTRAANLRRAYGIAC